MMNLVPMRFGPQGIGPLWRGHVFLFDKEPALPTYEPVTGTRLLLIVAGLEVVRLALSELPLLPLWCEVPIYLALALASVHFIARVPLSQIGFHPWREWNATEKSYFVEILLIANVVFPILFGPRLRAILAETSVMTIVWTVFVPYFVFGFYQEVLYRGMLQTELARRWGPVAGILVSNMIYTFGPLHASYFCSKASLAIPMFAGIFAIGLVFAILFRRSSNLWIVAMMHAFGNSYIAGSLGATR